MLRKVPKKITELLGKIKSKTYDSWKEPRFQVPLQGPSKGPVNATVIIVEFSDFECPFCKVAQGPLQEVLHAYNQQVRLVFRALAPSSHPHAFQAAEAGYCAEEQGKFWEMHDMMFMHQDKLTIPSLKWMASQIKLNLALFTSCLDSKRYAKGVQENNAESEKLQLTGTPTFFINGRKLVGAQPFEKFKKIIEEELPKK